MAVASFMVPLGTPAPEFTLPAVDGSKVSSHELPADARALLVMFLCNHCPYVRHIEPVLARLIVEAQMRGLVAVGICSNDVEAYPEDGVDGLAAQIERAGFTFPYLIDESQAVAKAYQAACTPDFFLYGADRRLAYRGQFDASRPGRGDATGESLHDAIDLVLAGAPVPEPHKPSTGCGIKWRPGNSPV